MPDGVSVPAEDSAELYLLKNLKKLSLQISPEKKLQLDISLLWIRMHSFPYWRRGKGRVGAVVWKSCVKRGLGLVFCGVSTTCSVVYVQSTVSLGTRCPYCCDLWQQKAEQTAAGGGGSDGYNH